MTPKELGWVGPYLLAIYKGWRRIFQDIEVFGIFCLLGREGGKKRTISRRNPISNS